MPTITDVINEVRKIATERPDFNYREQPMKNPELRGEHCSYLGASVGVPEGEGCIVGQALSRLGISTEDLKEHESLPASTVCSSLGLADYDYRPPLEWLDSVQGKQDSGATWGEAVLAADDEFSVE